jgi:hypothetical protein
MSEHAHEGKWHWDEWCVAFVIVAMSMTLESAAAEADLD